MTRIRRLFDEAIKERFQIKSAVEHLITECFFSYQDLSFNQEIVYTFKLLDYYQDHVLKSFCQAYISKNTDNNRIFLQICCKHGFLSLKVSRYKNKNKNINGIVIGLESKKHIIDFVLALKLKFHNDYDIIVDRELVKYKNEAV